MWDGKLKAVTFSYDDGVEQDRRLAGIFNRYGIKATFNLNSGLMSRNSFFIKNGLTIRRMNAKGLRDLYRGHEIAAHCLTHADLTDCDDDTVYNEVTRDIAGLEQLFGQKINGMAYPFGRYDMRIKNILRECGIRYARTVLETGGFSLSPDLLELRASAHHNRPDLTDMVRRFTALKAETPSLLYIWGHSYEFETDGNWDRIELICSMLSGRDDIFFGTNSEVLLPLYPEVK